MNLKINPWVHTVIFRLQTSEILWHCVFFNFFLFLHICWYWYMHYILIHPQDSETLWTFIWPLLFLHIGKVRIFCPLTLNLTFTQTFLHFYISLKNDLMKIPDPTHFCTYRQLCAHRQRKRTDRKRGNIILSNYILQKSQITLAGDGMIEIICSSARAAITAWFITSRLQQSNAEPGH